jgi:hypothetical protein
MGFKALRRIRRRAQRGMRRPAPPRRSWLVAAARGSWRPPPDAGAAASCCVGKLKIKKPLIKSKKGGDPVQTEVPKARGHHRRPSHTQSGPRRLGVANGSHELPTGSLALVQTG